MIQQEGAVALPPQRRDDPPRRMRCPWMQVAFGARRWNVLGTRLVLCLIVGAGVGWPIRTAHAADPTQLIQGWFRRAEESCFPGRNSPIRILVLGLDLGSGSLSEAEESYLKQDVQALLGRAIKADRIQLVDPNVVKVEQWYDEFRAKRLSAEELPELLAADLVVFISARRVSANAVSYTISGHASKGPNGSCSVSMGGAIAYEIPKGPYIQNLQRVLSNFLKQALDKRPGTEEIDICPAAPEGNKFHDCSEPLRDAAAAAIHGSSSANRMLTGRNLRHRKVPSEVCAKGSKNPMLALRFSPNPDRGTLNLSLDFTADGSTLHTTTAEVGDLPCPTPPSRTLQEEVLATAKANPVLLEVTAGRKRFKVGEWVDIKIRTGAALHLYCWAIAPNDTANIYMPSQISGSVSRTRGAGVWSYPGRDFGVGQAAFEMPERDLMGCFGARAQLPPELHKAWLSGWCKGPDGNPVPKNLDRETILSLLRKTREVPNVVEAYDWLQVIGDTTQTAPPGNPCADATPPTPNRP